MNHEVWLVMVVIGFYIVPSPMLHFFFSIISWNKSGQKISSHLLPSHGPERISTLASAWVPGSSAQFMWLVVDEQVTRGDSNLTFPCETFSLVCSRWKLRYSEISEIWCCAGFIFALKVLDKRQLIKHRVEHQLRCELLFELYKIVW